MTAVFAGKGTVEPHLMATSLIQVTWLFWPNVSGPLVTVLMGFHCTMKTVMCDMNNAQRGIYTVMTTLSPFIQWDIQSMFNDQRSLKCNRKS